MSVSECVIARSFAALQLRTFASHVCVSCVEAHIASLNPTHLCEKPMAWYARSLSEVLSSPATCPSTLPYCTQVRQEAEDEGSEGLEN